MNPRKRSARRRRLAAIAALALTVLRPLMGEEPPHPILPTAGTGGGAAEIMSRYTDAQFLAFVPQGPPRQARPFAPPVVPGDTGWSWSVTAPDQIRGMPSGTVFPNSGVKYLPIAVLSGKTIQVPYYPAAGRPAQISLVHGEIDNQKRKQLRRFLNTLTPAYLASGATHATRHQAYARRIALALDAWANHVPDYFMTEKGGPTLVSATGFTTLTKDLQRASDHNGLAHEWQEDELLAFDAIYDSPALQELSAQRGYDVRQHIARGLFLDIGSYLVERVPIPVAIATNLSGSFTVLAKVATVLNRPDYIAWMGDYLDATIRRKLLRDGVLGEGIGYSFHYLVENRKSAGSTHAYFTTRAATTPALGHVRNRARMYRDLIDRGIEAWASIRLPDGQLPSFGDTGFEGTAARHAGSSALLPAYGHLALGAGTTAATAVQLNQGFSDDANHMRADVTAFGLWAFGDELLGNIRYYNALPGRQLTEQILAHNAVTVNRANLSRDSWQVGGAGHRFTSGTLTLFEPGHHGLAVTEIDGQRPYASQASRYQRILILNTADLACPYVVDVFRVTGGTIHDYALHGSIRFDQTGESSVPLTTMPGPHPLLEGGEVWREPQTSGDPFPYYGVFRDVSTGRPAGDFHVTFRDAGDAHRDLRLWMTGDGSSTVFLGRSPNPGRTNNAMNLYTHWRPSLLVRNRIAAGTLQSLYAGVVEPMKGGAGTIRSVTRLPLADPSLEAVALRVAFAHGRVDTYLIDLRNPRVAGVAGGPATVATADGRLSLQGRVGVLQQRPGDSRVWTVAASAFTYPGGVYSPDRQLYSGTVLGATRRAAGAPHDAFIVSDPLPAGTALRGRQLSLTFGDYRVVGSATVQPGLSEMFEIDRVERVGGQTHVVMKSDPQLTIHGATTTELVAPERTFTGPNRYEIALSASTVPSG